MAWYKFLHISSSSSSSNSGISISSICISSSNSSSSSSSSSNSGISISSICISSSNSSSSSSSSNSSSSCSSSSIAYYNCCIMSVKCAGAWQFSALYLNMLDSILNDAVDKRLVALNVMLEALLPFLEVTAEYNARGGWVPDWDYILHS